jgi:hypothetical protein
MRKLEHAENVRLGSDDVLTFTFSASSDDDGSTKILLQPAGPERVTMTKNAALSNITVTTSDVTHLSTPIVDSMGILLVVEADKSNELNERNDRSLPLSLAVIPATVTLKVAPTRVKLMGPPMESTFEKPKSPTRSPQKEKNQRIGRENRKVQRQHK